MKSGISRWVSAQFGFGLLQHHFHFQVLREKAQNLQTESLTLQARLDERDSDLVCESHEYKYVSLTFILSQSSVTTELISLKDIQVRIRTIP